MKPRSAGCCSALTLLAGCISNHAQSAIHPAGPAATAVTRVLLLMLAIASVVYVLVLGVLLFLARRRHADDPGTPARERKAQRVIMVAVVVTVLILFAVLLTDFSVAHGLATHPNSAQLSIQVTGHQWWWEIEYEDTVPARRALLANEIHLPVGRPALIKLVSHDVIHSFWVPTLAGKKDLIPGHRTSLWIQGDSIGVFRGPCAEFCGAEHAKMALTVVVESQADFSAWLANQRTAPSIPTDSLAATGRQLFESGRCAACHSILSTLAAGRVGPNLSHVASRLTLGAGTLANDPVHLAGWITDPQAFKPGAQMPPSGLTPGELRAIVAYLETLR